MPGKSNQGVTDSVSLSRQLPYPLFSTSIDSFHDQIFSTEDESHLSNFANARVTPLFRPGDGTLLQKVRG